MPTVIPISIQYTGPVNRSAGRKETKAFLTEKFNEIADILATHSAVLTPDTVSPSAATASATIDEDQLEKLAAALASKSYVVRRDPLVNAELSYPL